MSRWTRTGELLKRTLDLEASVPLWSAAVAVLVSAGIGLGFGVLPANRAARLDPVEALRHGERAFGALGHPGDTRTEASMSRAALVLILPVILAAACDAPRALPERAASDPSATVTAALAPPASPVRRSSWTAPNHSSIPRRHACSSGRATRASRWIPLSRQSTRCISSRGGWAGGSPEPHLQVARISCAGHAAAAIPADRFGDAQGASERWAGSSG